MDASLSSGKNKALVSIAVSKDSTIRIFDRQYVDCEAWRARKSVEQNTPIANYLVRNQVAQALNGDSKQTKDTQNQAFKINNR